MLTLLLVACLGSDESGGGDDLPTLTGWKSYECDSSGRNKFDYDGPRPILVWTKTGGGGVWEQSTDFTAGFVPASDYDDDLIQVSVKAPCVIFIGQ